MAKIGILTFHSAHNFGAMLQTYAMQTFLENLGHEVKVIDHYSYEQHAQYPKLPIDYKLSTLKEIAYHPLLTYKKYKGWYKYRDFMRTNMHLTRHATILNHVKEVIEEECFDIVLNAGDQIWNVNCLDWCLAYFLPFKINAKKVAYAPSLGGLSDWNPEDYKPILQATLGNYSELSVREGTASKILSSILQRHVDVMPDPAWLISNIEYDKIMTQPEKPLEKGKYILYYSPASDVVLDWAIEYAKSRNKKLIVLSKVGRNYRHVLYRFNVGPSEFLNYVKYADEIVGCSMHLLIFSILYEKEFIILQHKYDSRLIDLMLSIGLSDRLVPIETEVSSFIYPTSCVENVVKKIVVEYRKKAKAYFDNCMK